MQGRRRGTTGLALALLSAATFGTSGSFAAALIATGWSPGAAVAARLGLAALVLTVPAVLALRGRWSLLRRGARSIAVYGLLAVAGAQLFFFNAVSHLSVGVALLLEYLGSLLVVGWLWLRHHQRPRRLTTAGAAVAMLGLALVLLNGTVRVDLVGVLWGLGAAVGLAVFFVLAAGDDPLPPVAMAWAGMCVGALTLLLLGAVGVLPMHASTRPVTLVGRQVGWLVPVLSLGLVAAAFAYVAGIAAARRLGAKVASFVGLTEVLFAVSWAWLLLSQLPAPVQVVGGGVVVLGVALVRVDELRSPPTDQDARDPVGTPSPPIPGRRPLRRASMSR